MKNKKIYITAILFIFGFLILGLWSFGSLTLFKHFCQTLIPARSEFGKSPVLDKERVAEGFTLITPLNRTEVPVTESSIYLVDLFGRPVHIWKTSNKTHYSILKNNGNVLSAQLNPVDKNYPYAGRITTIQELDPDSNVVWEYQNGAMHHDFDILPNNNLAVLVWQEVPDGLANFIKGGKPGTEFNKVNIFSDAILEIDHDKNVVWSWSASKYLDPNEYEIPAFFTREQWTHANSLKYVQSDPFYGKESYLVSMRYLNEVFLISKETGEIIWKSPKGLLGHQHDATILDNGHILVFNNAYYTEVSPNPYGYGSQVLEIDPKTNKIVWEFSGGNNPLDRSRLTEVILSGAQRLPNGNTLITLGTSGRIIEVTPDKKIVWDMINPYSGPTSESFPSNYIFKARKYSNEYAGKVVKSKDPIHGLNSYCW